MYLFYKVGGQIFHVPDQQGCEKRYRRTELKQLTVLKVLGTLLLLKGEKMATSTGSKRKAVILVRGDSSGNESFPGIEKQEMMCKNYCGAENGDIVKIFRIEAGSDPFSPEKTMGTIMRFCKKNRHRIDDFVIAQLIPVFQSVEEFQYVASRLDKWEILLTNIEEADGSYVPNSMLRLNFMFVDSIRALRLLSHQSRGREQEQAEIDSIFL